MHAEWHPAFKTNGDNPEFKGSATSQSNDLALVADGQRHVKASQVGFVEDWVGKALCDAAGTRKPAKGWFHKGGFGWVRPACDEPAVPRGSPLPSQLDAVSRQSILLARRRVKMNPISRDSR